jgi:hypothetical protein
MTFISWRRQLLLSTLEECVSSTSCGRKEAAAGEARHGAFEDLHRRLTASLPVKEIVATVEDLLTAHRNLCTPQQRQLLRAYLDQLLVPAR